MKKSILTLLFLGICTILLAQDQTTFVLVRHAEKADDGTKDPSLSEQGSKRAKSLASLFENEPVAALYSTPFKRTGQTLEPLAKTKSVAIISYDPFAGKEWLIQLIEAHKGETIIISGHSNTIPGLANILLGEEALQQFEEGEYNNLLIIVTSEVGKGTLVRLNLN